MATGGSSDFTWLRTGDEAFAGMRAAIDAAHSSVRMEMYIFAGDALGLQFRDALVRACGRGVPVQVLIDAFGSLELSASFWDPLVAAGGAFRWFNPLALERLAIRNHRKLLVCDDAVAFVGGFNVAVSFQGDGVTQGWRDVGLRVSGALAKELAESFDEMFARADLRHRRFVRLRRSTAKRVVRVDDDQLLLMGPGRGRNILKRSLRADLRPAREVTLIAAYFLPPWRLRRALMRVARRGGSVQLILAGKSDVRLSQLATRGLYEALLRAGVEIYEYQPQILHAKLIVIDHITYLGSSNLDARSLDINYELMVRVDDAGLAREARLVFADALQHCQRVDPSAWRRSRTFWDRLKERWAHFLLTRVDVYLARRQLRNLR